MLGGGRRSLPRSDLEPSLKEDAMGPNSRSVLAVLAILVSLLAIAVLAQGDVSKPEVATGTASGLPGELAAIQPQATIHCCAQGAADACRTECKVLGPGCKGQIGCRAGECVCTCTCP